MQEREGLLGHTCKHKLETCLVLSEEENAFDYFNLAGTIISREEAHNFLKQVEDDGLVHTSFYNVKERLTAICNCCPCCCGVIGRKRIQRAAYTGEKQHGEMIRL